MKLTPVSEGDLVEVASHLRLMITRAARRMRQEAPVYYDFEEPVPRRRSVWPWLLALLLLVAASLAGWYAYSGDPMDVTLGVVQRFVSNGRDAWELATEIRKRGADDASLLQAYTARRRLDRFGGIGFG